MSWLKKAGQILLKLTELATGLGPILTPLVPPKTQGAVAVVTNDLTQVASVITAVETFAAGVQTTNPDGSKLSAAQKLAAALPLETQIIMASQVMDGKKIHDEAGFIEGVKLINDGMVKILNAVEQK